MDITMQPGGSLGARRADIIFTGVVGAAILSLWIYFA